MWASRLIRRGDLLDMSRLSGAVIALDHNPAIAREAGADRQRRVRIEHVSRVEVGHAFVGLAERGHLHVAVDAEEVANLGDLVGRGEDGVAAAFGLHIGKVGHRRAPYAKAAGASTKCIKRPFPATGRR